MSNGSFVSSCHQWGCSDWHYGESWGEEAIVVSCVSWATLVQRLAEISVYKATTPDAVQQSPWISPIWWILLPQVCLQYCYSQTGPSPLRRAYDRFKVSLTVDVTISLILCTSWIMRTTLQRAQHCKSGKVWISTNYKLIHTFLS